MVSKDPEIEQTIASLRDTYKVAYVAPGHCTGEPTFTALKKAFGERYLYAGLGSTFSLGATPRSVGASARLGASPLSEDDAVGYQALLAASGRQRRQQGLFTNLHHRNAMPSGAYLAEWRRSMAGCC